MPGKQIVSRVLWAALVLLPAANGAACAEEPGGRTDLDGSPLPERAICRLGTQRFLHADFVTLTGFSPDQKKFASLSVNRELIIWDWPAGKHIQTIPILSSFEPAFRFSPDGMCLALWTSELRLINIAERKVLWNDRKPTCPPVFSPKEPVMAWVDDGKQIQRFNYSTAESLPVLRRPHRVKGLAYTPQGDLLVAEEREGKISLHHLATGKKICAVDAPAEAVLWMDVHPQARHLAYFTQAGEIKVLNPLERDNVWVGGGVPKDFEPRAVSPDGKRALLIDRRTSRGLLWSVSEGKAIGDLTSAGVGYGSFSPDGQWLATGATNSPHAATFWDGQTGQRKEPYPGHYSFLTGLAFSPDGKEVATCTSIRNDPAVRFWDPQTGQHRRKLSAHAGGVWRVAYSPDGSQLATCGGFGTSSVWHSRTLEKRWDFQGHRYWAQWVAFSEDGKRLASVGGGTSVDDVVVWDLESGSQLASHGALGTSSQNVWFLPGSQTLALTGSEGIRFWNPEGKWEKKPLKMKAVRFALSPNGLVVAALSAGTLRLVDTQTGLDIHQFPDVGRGSSVAFADNGRTLAMGTSDGTVRLFDWSERRERASFRAAENGPYHLTFSPDGKRLAGVENTTALVWDVADVVAPSPRNVHGKTTDIDVWCGLLSSKESPLAYEAVWTLAAIPDHALPKLKRLLTSFRPGNPKQIELWIKDLDSTEFAVREKALAELRRFGDMIRAPVEAALQNPLSLEQRRRLETLKESLSRENATSEEMTIRRAIMAIEQMNTPQARAVLEELARDQTNVLVSSHARVAAMRLRASQR